MVTVSASVRKNIESIKEVFGNHSDNDIFNALNESNMNPDEAVHKLMHQDTFHEVRKRRDKKKEVIISKKEDNNYQAETRKDNDYVSRGPKLDSGSNGRGPKLDSGSNGRRGVYTRRGVSQQFRVVRDNRVNQSSARETPSSNQILERSGHVASNNQRHPGGRSAQNPNGRPDFHPKGAQESNNSRKEHREETISPSTGPSSQVSVTKQNESQLHSGSSAPSSAVGVYASASDPVHVPSPAVGATRREIGVVGGRRQVSENGSKQSNQRVSNFNSSLGSSSATHGLRHANTVSRSDQNHGTNVESVMINTGGSRYSNHVSNRSHQQPAGQKGALPSKEWKPKTNQKPSASNPGVIGSPVKSASHQTDTSKDVERETDELQDKLTQINIHDTQKVILAQNIRVAEFDRCRLIFGSIGMELDNIENPSSAFQAADVVEDADDVERVEASPSNIQINAFDDQGPSSASSSPSGDSSENPSPDNQNDSAGVPNNENYAEISVAHNNPSFTTSNSEQLQESTELHNFSAYDPQPMYDIPYFRPSADDAVRVTGLPSNQEGLSSHTATLVPNSSVSMMQQQTPIGQMYPQVHLSHFTNVMPYRQFIPPMYVPPMVPGYSGNPGYPHLSNGSSYVLMPGGGSHVPPNGLKYDIQQFKPFPVGSPTGFGSMVSPTGYAMNAPGVVGGPTGHDDPSRLKYKDNNLYVPNPQAETSGVWIQNHREHPGMQSTPYFNMQGQTAAHPAYMQSLTAHPSFNTAVPQSSQMQFQGMYPPQPAGIPNAHHMSPGNIGVGVGPTAPGPQVGPYQQPQMNHLNWTTNF